MISVKLASESITDHIQINVSKKKPWLRLMINVNKNWISNQFQLQCTTGRDWPFSIIVSYLVPNEIIH